MAVKKLYKLQLLAFSILAGLTLLSNSGLHPITGTGGYTGAPGDSLCSSCHTGSNPNLNGEISISGLPATIMPSTTYPLTITVTNPNSNATRAGFQIVALNASNNNAGTFSNNSANSQLRVSGGKTYLGHSPAVNFGSGTEISWTVDWTSPASGSGNITVYGSTVIANGNGANSGDRVRFTSVSGSFGPMPDPLVVSITNIQGTSCHDSQDGTATATVSGGTPPYMYTWSNGSTVQSPNNLPSGNVSVTVTDAGSQTAIATEIVPSPDPLVLEISEMVQARCFDSNDGYVLLNYYGGTPPYQLLWSNGFTGYEGYPLPVGYYTVTLTDGNNCMTTLDFEITNPDPITLTQTIINHLSCYESGDGSITVELGGGTPNYMYEWNTGSTNNFIQNLNAGNYELTVVDSQDCIVSFSFQINQPENIDIITLILEIPDCTNSENGSLLAIPNGGSGSGFSFLWSNGHIDNQINDLPSGDYTITVTDDTGCTNSATISLPAESNLNIAYYEIGNSSCANAADGTIALEIVGEQGEFSIAWSNGDSGDYITALMAGNYTATITDESNCEIVTTFTVESLPFPNYSWDVSNVSCHGGDDGSVNISIENGFEDYMVSWSDGFTGTNRDGLSSGTYTFTLSKNDECSITDSVIISEPTNIEVSELIQHVLCHGDSTGSILVDVFGEQEGFTFEWSNGTQEYYNENLAAGNYTLTITDTMECMYVFDYTVNQPDAIQIEDLQSSEPICYGDSTGMLLLTASGGFGDLSILWSDGNESFMRHGLPAGNYDFVITDENGCSLFESIEINQPSEITATFTVTNESQSGANDGSISINTLSGGTGQISTLWSTGSTDNRIENLSPGSYTVTFTDENGCEKVYQINVSGGGCTIRADLEVTPPSCWNSNDGRISVRFDNDPQDYEIIIRPDANIDSLSAGVYSVTVSYGENCFIEFDSIAIIAPAPINVTTIINIDASGADSPDGGFEIEVEGGSGNYTYQWVDEKGELVSTEQNPNNLKPGRYTLIVTDENDCSLTKEDMIVDYTNSVSTPYLGKWVVYPNPSDGLIEINSEFVISELSIFDFTGRKIQNLKIGTSTALINIAQLTSGIYTLQVNNEQGSSVKKLIKK